MLETGSLAPSFTLPSGDGQTVSLEDFRGRNVVLYFYPRDDTPGCTTQACDLRDSWQAIQETGAVVLGVSPDPPESHARFADKFGLPFPLLSDEDHAVADAYEAWGEKSMYGKKYFGIIRSTTIIDPEGRVSHHFPRVKPSEHLSTVLKALGAAA